jgi:hypothetical protein
MVFEPELPGGSHAVLQHAGPTLPRQQGLSAGHGQRLMTTVPILASGA